MFSAIVTTAVIGLSPARSGKRYVDTFRIIDVTHHRCAESASRHSAGESMSL
jgi:hypothetical protein